MVTIPFLRPALFEAGASERPQPCLKDRLVQKTHHTHNRGCTMTLTYGCSTDACACRGGIGQQGNHRGKQVLDGAGCGGTTSS